MKNKKIIIIVVSIATIALVIFLFWDKIKAYLDKQKNNYYTENDSNFVTSAQTIPAITTPTPPPLNINPTNFSTAGSMNVGTRLRTKTYANLYYTDANGGFSSNVYKSLVSGEYAGTYTGVKAGTANAYLKVFYKNGYYYILKTSVVNY